MQSKDSRIFFEDISVNCRDKVILIDIDGTLLPDSKCQLDTDVINAVKLLKKDNAVYLCTNSRNHKRNQAIADRLDLKIINHDHRKPNKKIIQSIPAAKSKRFVVIGDKFLTDAWFASNIGAEFIMTKRKLTNREPFKIKLFNFIDDLVYNLIRFFD